MILHRIERLTTAFCFTITFALLGLPGGSRTATAALTFFSSRIAFEAVNPGLAVEDFEEGIPDLDFGSPLNSTSNNGAFSPGDILPGVAFSNNPDDNLIIATSVAGGAQPLPSKVLFKGADGGSSSLDISFSIDALAMGLDLYHWTGGLAPLIAAETTVSVFGDAGLLGSEVVTTSASGPIFFGVVSDSDQITRVNVDGIVPGAFSFEGIDNVTFIPEPSAGWLVTAGVIGLVLSRRRRG